MGWKYRIRETIRRFFAVHQSLYYRLDRTLVPALDSPAKWTAASSENVSVEQVVRDLYDGNAAERTFYENYTRQGIKHWSALQEGNVIGVVWLYTGYYLAQWEGYDAWLLRVEIEPTARFVCNVFVPPQYRGQGVFPFIALRCFAEHPDSGFYSCVSADNRSSRRSHEKVGFRRCAAAYYVRFFRITLCYFVTTTGKRRFFRLTKGNVVDVSLID